MALDALVRPRPFAHEAGGRRRVELKNDGSQRKIAPLAVAREIEVLLAWLRSESKDEAARELFISPATVSTHIIRIRAKYAAVGRPAKRKASLFARAIQDGYTTLDEW